MMTRLEDVLGGKAANYLFPFFWQHGEQEDVLREYVAAIADSGCGAFCVEARPHPDFCGDGWWRDMDVILEEAKRRGMKVWILDDAHFPTGYANGALKRAGVEFRKQYLFFSRTDVCGPLPQATLDVGAMARSRPDLVGETAFRMGYAPEAFDDDDLLAVVAGRVCRDDQMDMLLDLTPLVEGGALAWDVPPGMWKVFVLYLTRNGGGRTDYINVLNRGSCRLQIDAVYEPHYARYGAEFGGTIAGFFSDEPLFGNTNGYQMDELIGRKIMPLPWCDEMSDMMVERLGTGWTLELPLLWESAVEAHRAARARHAYMDAATLLVERHFSNQLGDWCRAHGVEYVGHIIEDNGQHARLGCSLGHYFRSLNGQDMAGIDDIGGQVLPGGEDLVRAPMHGARGGSGEFYHFLLGKLASSYAHIDPKKKGRAMCEIFGAYGWGLGVRSMKYLADHFLVRGINRFVPHAFSPKAYPDPDCPPHFYAHGKNPQFRHFGNLMRYMNRVCHLLDGATHVAPVALLYHAEAEWAGEYMPDEKAARALHENQIDFDVLPADVFADPTRYDARLDGEALVVGQEVYQALVIPYSQFLIGAVAAYAADAARRGFPVFIIDALPKGISDMDDMGEARALLSGLARCQVVSLPELAGRVRSMAECDFEIAPAFRRLRYYHGRSEGREMYLVLNEDPSELYKGTATVPVAGSTTLYDAFWNEVSPANCQVVGLGLQIRLELPPLGMAILVIDPAQPAPKQFLPDAVPTRRPVHADWKLSIAKSEEYPDFRDERIVYKLESVAKLYPHFSGHMLYEAMIELDASRADPAYLELEDAYETAELWVNSACAGVCIAPPYRFPVEGLFKSGENCVRVEVTSSLARENHMAIENARHAARESKLFAPTGIIGGAHLVYYSAVL